MNSSSSFSPNGIIVISCDDQSPEHVIQSILDVDAVPNTSAIIDSIKGYEWNIKTKYYAAKATVYSITEKRSFNSSFAETIQGTVFYFNGNQHSSFENVLSWMPVLKDVSSEVKLLICENCSQDETHKRNILEWCIDNEFELVELQENDDGENDGDIISKNNGYCRVRDALHTCSWPNLVLTSDASSMNAVSEGNATNADAVRLDCDLKPDKKSNEVKVDDDEVKLEEQWLQKVFEHDEPGEESFEALFSKFASMKEKASNLNGEDRKKYAEKVAIAFCKAMGCEDEIEGLDSD